MSRLPDFLGIGPPRTGTTWLHHCLARHPEVFLPEPKQVHFFDRSFDRGVSWYRSRFAAAGAGHRAIGEITPDYFSSSDGPSRIAETLGTEVRILVLYRDPVDRAYSHYRIGRRTGRYRDVGFLEALESDPWLVENGLYGKHVRAYLRVFGCDRIWVGAYRDVARAPQALVLSAVEFLGLTGAWRPDPSILARRYAESLPAARHRRLDAAIIRLRRVMERTRMGRRLAAVLRSGGLVATYHRANADEGDALPSEPELRTAARRFEHDARDFRTLLDELIHVPAALRS